MDEKQAVLNEIEDKIKRTARMIRQAEEMGRDPDPLRNQLAGHWRAKTQVEAELRKLAEKMRRLKEGESNELAER